MTIPKYWRPPKFDHGTYRKPMCNYFLFAWLSESRSDHKKLMMDGWNRHCLCDIETSNEICAISGISNGYSYIINLWLSWLF
jgi:hypothetical protein